MKRTQLVKRSATAALLAVAALAIGATFGVAGNGTAASTAVPTNQSPPTVSGTTEDGSTLTASNGTWNGTTPITYTYQWRRCDDTGGSCASISGATNQTYVLKGVDVGNTMRVRVTAKNSSGSNNATSVPTAVVKSKPGPPPTSANGCPTSGSGTVDIKDVSSPAHLLIDGQSISPTVVTRTTRVDHRSLPRDCVLRPSGAGGPRLRDGCPVLAVHDPARVDDRCGRMGDVDDEPGSLLPGFVPAAAARHAGSCPQVGRADPRRHLGPPPRLVPGPPLTTRSRSARIALR